MRGFADVSWASCVEAKSPHACVAPATQPRTRPVAQSLSQPALAAGQATDFRPAPARDICPPVPPAAITSSGAPHRGAPRRKQVRKICPAAADQW